MKMILRFHLLYAGFVVVFAGIPGPGLNAIGMSWGPCDSLEILVDLTPPPCAGKSAMLNLGGQNGSVPYSFSVDGGLTWVQSTAHALFAGTFSIFIEDASGCRKDTVLTITEPPQLFLQVLQDTFSTGNTGQINLLASGQGGTPPYTFLWSPPQGLSCTSCVNPTVQAGVAGAYSVVIADAKGCSRSLSIAIDGTVNIHLFIPDAFSPDGNGINDLFEVYASGIGIRAITLIQVWDPWGGLVWESGPAPLGDPILAWDGRSRGSMLDPGVYTYVVVVDRVDGRKSVFKGDLQLIK